MPAATYVPSRVGEGYFTDFASPAAGATDNNKAWLWSNATGKFAPGVVVLGAAGSNGQVQFNSGGTFAGDAGMSYDSTNKFVALKTSGNQASGVKGKAVTITTNDNVLVGYMGHYSTPAALAFFDQLDTLILQLNSTAVGIARPLSNIGGTTQIQGRADVNPGISFSYVDGTGVTGSYPLLRLTGGTAGANIQEWRSSDGTLRSAVDTNGKLLISALRPLSDSTSAIQLQNAAGAAIVTVDTTNKFVGINTTPSNATMHIQAANQYHIPLYVRHTAGPQTVIAHFGTTTGNESYFVEIDHLGQFNMSNSVTGTRTTYGYDKTWLRSFGSNYSFMIDSWGNAVANNILFIPGSNDGSSGSIYLVGKGAGYGVYLNWNGTGSLNGIALAGHLGSTGIFVRASDGYCGVHVTDPTALFDIAASTTSRASLRFRAGVAPSSPNDGDVWFDGSNIKCQIGGVTKTFTVN